MNMTHGLIFTLQVIFSDEKKWNLDGPDGQRSYWHDLRKEPLVFSKRNFGGGSVMVWAAFNGYGKVGLAFVSSKMNSTDYQEVVGWALDHFLPQIGGRSIEFQQDNARIHVSRSTRAWFAGRRVPLLEWPSRSPDLNPMENLWAIMARRVYANNKQYGTVEELQEGIWRAFLSVEQEVIDNLVRSMPTRMFQLINRNGGLTDY